MRTIKTFVILIVMASPLFALAAQQGGTVQSGDTAIVSSTVTLYSTGRHHRHSVDVLGKARTDEDGYFEISYKRPRHRKALLYLVAAGGFASTSDGEERWSERHRRWRGGHRSSRNHGHNASPIRFATVLGIDPEGDDVVLNERTTVATAYTMAQFIDGINIRGKGPGPRNAADILRNVVDVYTGEVSMFLTLDPLTNPNSGTSTEPTLNSLANLLAVCVNDEAECQSLFNLTTPPGGKAPHNTLQAAVNIVLFPSLNAGDLFDLSNQQSIYEPAIDPNEPPPDAWTLVILYNGNGEEMDGPGWIAFDRHGNAWITNNYTFSSDTDSETVVCGDNHLLKLTPSGDDFPGFPDAPYVGGGLYGAGIGITFDPKGKIWVGNFGFQGSNCENVKLALSVSVSKFNADGEALSPKSPDEDPYNRDQPGGFTADGSILQPQGTVSDKKGNIWIANCSGASVTKLRRGNPDRAVNFAPIDGSGDPLIQKPFGIAIDKNGRAWVSSNNNDSVIGLNPNGSVFRALKNGVAGITRPMGITSDSLGNVWVANSGVMDPPCKAKPSDPDTEEDSQFELINNLPGDFQGENASVTLIRRDGRPSRGSPYKGGGLILPWGIAVDGNDNVWVANFDSQRLSHICGARWWTCPRGLRTGDAISPDSGYGFDGLVRNTGVSIDPSGNVWVTNNWQIDVKLSNPGGHEVAVFIGLAKPVKTPLIGPPEQP
ncbi:MAG: hypothetical protein GY850_28865 [bacterium]|nr:hypothetical protein [bacterium]